MLLLKDTREPSRNEPSFDSKLSLSFAGVHARGSGGCCWGIYRGVARIFHRGGGVTMGQTLSSWRFRHGIL